MADARSTAWAKTLVPDEVSLVISPHNEIRHGLRTYRWVLRAALQDDSGGSNLAHKGGSHLSAPFAEF